MHFKINNSKLVIFFRLAGHLRASTGSLKGFMDYDRGAENHIIFHMSMVDLLIKV